MKNQKKKYFILEMNDGLHLNEKGYFRIINGVLFKSNGFEEYANDKGIIVRPDLVAWKRFDYDYYVPFKRYFKEKYKIKVNTRLRIILKDSDFIKYDDTPVYVFLNWKEKLLLSHMNKKLLVQKANFWMWLINVIVAIGAAIVGFLVVFC